jgi:hypothetical protein
LQSAACKFSLGIVHSCVHRSGMNGVQDPNRMSHRELYSRKMYSSLSVTRASGS